MRHKNENFWTVWPNVLEHNTYIITNPPFGRGCKYFLEAFLKFIVTFNRPFVLILSNTICIRKYFASALSRIQRPEDLHIWGLAKNFHMENEAEEKVTGFTGLTILCCLQKRKEFCA